jgi:BlaI family transcriptional regulator, penicillinase repressor
MRTPDRTLTPQELALMKIVWRRRSATVREIYEELRETRRIAYTSVMTMMNVLATKGYVTRVKDRRAFRYRPTQQKRTVLSSMVQEFVNRVFDGASRSLLLHLSKDRNLTAKERRDLRRLIEETE